VLVQLKRGWADGTSHLLFEPLEFLEKLAALTPIRMCPMLKPRGRTA